MGVYQKKNNYYDMWFNIIYNFISHNVWMTMVKLIDEDNELIIIKKK